MLTELTNKSFVERRKSKRFQIKEGGIALVTPPGPHSTTVGDIIDISMNGLSFNYVSNKALRNWAGDLAIASVEDRFYLRGLPSRSISDFEIAKSPFGSLSPRRHGLEFGELNREQTSCLEQFIMNHATGKV